MRNENVVGNLNVSGEQQYVVSVRCAAIKSEESKRAVVISRMIIADSSSGFPAQPGTRLLLYSQAQ
jgi:hypothetical protein